MMQKQELLAEAYKRGILPPEKAALYEEAVKRGIFNKEKITPKAEAEKPDVSKAESFLRGSAQGASAGFSDEITGGIRSLTNKVTRGIEKAIYGDDAVITPISYRTARDMSKAANEIAEEANPGSFLAGELTGLVGTGVAGASTKAGAAVGNFVRGGKVTADAGRLTRAGNFALQSAKGSALAAPTGAVYGAGTADEGERLKGAGLGAKYSAIAGAAGPIAGVAGSSLLKGTKSAIKGAFAKNSDDISQVVSGIKDTSSKYYKAMRDAGAQIKAPKVQEIISNIDSSLAERGKLNSELHRKTLSVLEDFKEASKAGRMDLEELDQFRKLLTRIKPTPESKEDAGMARAAVRAIDDVVAGLKPNSLTKGGAKAVSALNNARKDWAKASKLEEVGYLIQKADGDPNKIKSLFKNFVDKNDKNGWRGFTKEEIKAVREAASGTTAEKLMKMGGKFGIDLGTSTTVGNTILPAVSGVGVSPVVPVIGTVSRQLQKYMARGKAEEVIRVLQQGGMPKEIGKLPPKVAIQIIQSINNKKSIPLAQSTAPTADIMRGQ